MKLSNLYGTIYEQLQYINRHNVFLCAVSKPNKLG